MNTEKLQKVLARMGLGSRRELETWISEGRVSVNGQTATLGCRVGLDDRIYVNGKPVKLLPMERVRRRVIMYHKPDGEICTRHDPENRATVFAKLPLLRNGRWILVGRLDINSSGLLLFTNDGELANCLMHPSCSVEREYAVRIFGDVNEGMLRTLKRGVQLEDGPAQFDSITAVGGENSNSWFHVVLREGRNREVRRLWESQGVVVSRLMRVRYGSVSMPRELHLGRWQELTAPEVDELATLAGLTTTEKSFESAKRQNQRDAAPVGRKKSGSTTRDSAEELSSNPRRKSLSPHRQSTEYSPTKERKAPFSSSRGRDERPSTKERSPSSTRYSAEDLSSNPRRKSLSSHRQSNEYSPTKERKAPFSSSRGRDERSSTKERSPSFSSSKGSDDKPFPTTKRKITTSHLRSRTRRVDR